MPTPATTRIRSPLQLLLTLALLILAPQAFAKLTPNIAFSLSPAAGVVHYDGSVTALIVVRPASPGDPMPSGTLQVIYRDAQNSNIPYCTLTIDTGTQLQTCIFPASLPAGTPRIIIGYSGDANYDGNATGNYGEVDYPVTKATLSWTATPPALVLPGQPASYYVNVANPGDATGFLSISIGGGYACQVDVRDNFCTLQTPGVDTFPAALTYAGDANYNAIGATSVGALVVTPFPATMTLSAAPSSISLGDEATLTANLAISPVFGVPASGSITITDDGAYVCSMSTPSLSCTYRPTSAGTKTLVAHFAGSLVGAADATATFEVGEARVDGVCGSDNGKTLATTPTNLCSTGLASSVVGSGPWTWACAGIDNGSTASCSAQKIATATTPVASAPALGLRATMLLIALLASAGVRLARKHRRLQ